MLVSSNTEWKALKAILTDVDLQQTPFGEMFNHLVGARDVLFFHGGWGKVSAAATSQYVIDHYQPGLLVNLATAGGFRGHAAVGEVVCVTEALIYDIIEQMSDPQEAIDFYRSELDLTWLDRAWLPGVSFDRIVSADRDILAEEVPTLHERFGARVGDWESAPIAWVAGRNKQRLLILRGVTDLVGLGGGEVYDNMPHYEERTVMVMEKLLGLLGGMLAAPGFGETFSD